MAVASEAYLGIEEYKVVGTRPVRHDGADKVTGRAVYGTDYTSSDLLQGKVLRSPHAHARVISIDTSRAEEHPEVRAVVTGADLVANFEDRVEDLGEEVIRMKDLFASVMAHEKVFYHGFPVAAVAATSLSAAEEAVDLIEVEYEVLPPVLDVVEAMKEDAPLLHEDLQTLSLGELSGKSSNIGSHFQWVLGDIDKGFKEADVVIERTLNTKMVHQGYIEPQNATVLWGEDDRITIRCSNQGAFGVRDQVAKILGVPVSKIRVIPLEIGGGFGGKIRAYLEPIAALLSKKSGATVKMVMTRTEVLQSTGPASGAHLKVKVGAKKDGRLTAAEAMLAFESGGFPGASVSAGGRCMFAPYDIPNIQIDGYDVCTNKPSTSAYRAPGAPIGAFGAETVLNEIAEELGMDPLEFRLKNSAKEGTRRADGPIYPKIGHEECLKAIMESDHYQSKLDGPNQGRGVASGFWGNGGGISSASASVNADGTVNLVEGSTDIGGSRTSMAMQLAEVLGISIDDVNPMVGDTDAIGYTGVTGGSRTTFATGWASYNTAQDIKEQMIGRAAVHWEIPRDDVEFEDGVFRSKSDPARQMSFKEMAANLDSTGGPVMGRATVKPGGVGGAFATVAIDVEVDPDTGKVDILRATIAQDVGKAIYPPYVEGQMQGGIAQGVGWALNEEYVYDDEGRLVNSSLLDYRMPTTLDLPMIQTILVEVPNPGHPYGVRGVGEVPIVPPPAAVQQAIRNAVGVAMYNLPMSPPALLEGIWEKA
ncbi:MAG: oxidoreductase [Gemmatimonadetes bacterium]|nr:oxidoreductase [Gemmatimonadota bacterium]|tara:strand:+ start:3056 stop:5338 length:2283 start_codon:yes stop_codon:yes gene_type:complete